MKRSRLFIVLVAIIATTGVVAMTAKSGSDFDISWFSIDSGGGSSDREIWEVTGTMGQPDAGAPLSGGPWTVTGGFSMEIAEGDGEFRRGDCNGDGMIDIADGIFILIQLFGQPLTPSFCEDACDINGDRMEDISDAIYLFNFLFVLGPQPPPPWPDWGVSQNPESLGCMKYSACP